MLSNLGSVETCTKSAQRFAFICRESIRFWFSVLCWSLMSSLSDWVSSAQDHTHT
ncbi:hypothetical protein HanIR_Chr05g0220541 [Helianthus annuus]|nr:hypothetical protein HanIR_Chr05g0220541 [Helianthus annuus]